MLIPGSPQATGWRRDARAWSLAKGGDRDAAPRHIAQGMPTQRLVLQLPLMFSGSLTASRDGDWLARWLFNRDEDRHRAAEAVNQAKFNCRTSAFARWNKHFALRSDR
ncbi:hypothetical protein [Streptomyces acidiscabies]|nr:hypothetical protein [Streptomyces acidiscabies]